MDIDAMVVGVAAKRRRKGTRCFKAKLQSPYYGCKKVKRGHIR